MWPRRILSPIPVPSAWQSLLLLPLTIEGYELFPVIWKEQAVKYSRLWGGLSAGLVLIGGFVLRYVFVYAGQISHFLPLYVR